MTTQQLLACEEKVYCASGHPYGVTYLKLLIQKAEVDTRATAAHIRRNLAFYPQEVNQATIASLIYSPVILPAQTRNLLNIVRNVKMNTKKE
jgi:hypothetical protein